MEQMDEIPPPAGFSFSRLYAVVVVIGLIAGMIMIAQHLVFLSGVRDQADQVERYNMAVAGFQGKFGCLPGDCTNAAQNGLGDLSGDGDGDIIGFRSPAYPLAGSEKSSFWEHLSKSGFIEESFAVDPAMSIPVPGAGNTSPALRMKPKSTASSIDGGKNGGFWVAARDAVQSIGIASGHAWALVSAIAPGNGSIGVGMFSPYETSVLDGKIDDGYPLSGKMMAITRLLTVADGGITDGELKRDTTTSAGGQACIKDSVTPARYNTRVKSRSPVSLCAPVIAAPF